MLNTIVLCTATAAALVQPRLFPKQLEATAVDARAGRSPAVEIRVVNTNAAPRNASLALNTTRHFPLDPVIPPYIAAAATSFSYAMYCPEPLPDMPMRWVVTRDDGPSSGHPIDPASLATGTWHRITFPLEPPGTVKHPLNELILGIKAPAEARFSFYLADAALTCGDGQVYSMLSTNPPTFMTGYDPSKREAVFPPLPQRDTLAFGTSPRRFLKQLVRAGELPLALEDIRARFPDIDFVFSSVWLPRYLETADVIASLPEGFFYQQQKARLNGQYMAALDAWPRTAIGAKIDAFSQANSTVASHPLVRAALKDEMDYAATLGINNFVNADYNWPWHRGIGYGTWTVQVFRENLAGKDEGLELLPGPGGRPAEVIHFHDYYEQNHGVRWTPADVGIASWSEFTPVSAAAAADGAEADRRNYSLTTALAQYEWLRQAQRFGRWAKAHGGAHEYILNPEDVGGGSDYVYLLRLADAGIPYIEYFGSPTIMRSAYMRLPMYHRAARLSGKELGACTEIGQGGHGQNYWDPAVGYLAAYELGALGIGHYHIDWMESGWAAWTDPANAYHYDRYAGMMSQGHGWWQARHEKASRPAARVFTVSLRSSVHYIQAGVWTMAVEDSFEDALAAAHVDVEMTDTLELPEILPGADVLFYAPPVSRQIDAERLQAWLDAGGKTLITHSYIPLSLDRGAVPLRPGVKGTGFRGEEFNYKDYLDRLGHLGDAFALHPAFAALHRGAEDYWYLRAADQELDPSKPPWDRSADSANSWEWVRFGTGLARVHPLVSELPLENGSRLVYIHQRLEELPPRILRKIVAALIERYDLPRLARRDDATGPAIAHTFRAGDACVAVLWNERRLEELGWYGGYGPHLMPGRGPDIYDLDVRPYPIAAPGATCGAWVPVEQTGTTYRVYAVLADRESVVEASPDGRLRLQVPDLLGEQFYYAPDTPQFRTRMEGLRKRRREHLAPLWRTIGHGLR
ncbi:MAG: hypothetical protein JW951_08760 [Lentisphaerae bacterium]|nr:hypothetical protein [Lentisphaerota bacterium]